MSDTFVARSWEARIKNEKNILEEMVKTRIQNFSEGKSKPARLEKEMYQSPVNDEVFEEQRIKETKVTELANRKNGSCRTKT